MILLIDNYDSFVYNLARYFQQLGQATRVVRNDAIDVAGVRATNPDLIVLSPGPCTPTEAGCGIELVRAFQGMVPLLGVCLGHQTIGAAFGARVVRAPHPMHGRTSLVDHDRQGAFAGLEHPLLACRYHSLTLDESSLPADLVVTARTADGVIMGVRHRSLPVEGWQFHPESVLTRHGYLLLANLLDHFGINHAKIAMDDLPSPRADDPIVSPPPAPRTPITF